MVFTKDLVKGWWTRYLALVDIAEENNRLRDELKKAERLITLTLEERTELARLQKLLQMDALHEVNGSGARVIAMRFGPQAVLNTITINKGLADGAIAGTPVIAPGGVVGRIHRAAPHAATVLLLNDPGFRLGVLSQETRTPGIVRGVAGNPDLLEVTYVAQNAKIVEGELLITAGLDGGFPKGIPVGVVTAVQPGHETLFLQVHAKPVVSFDHLEEVVVLHPGDGLPPLVAPANPTNALGATNATATAPMAGTFNATSTKPGTANAVVANGTGQDSRMERPRRENQNATTGSARTPRRTQSPPAPQGRVTP
ncbi:rod shape-determining protein MreC [Desulfovibrio cuneatus]|uniref:rod shape-determining protein MreC n=1 Tax=Desulfovibrio cuneatus TaxID=159728 RepID=UPI0004093FA5|nr:rod shape-determining protein MreC [Desulfovibrio cuneatus]